jgi:hypothetical protein
MIGDGVIDIKSARRAVAAQGFAGYSSTSFLRRTRPLRTG